MVRSFAINLNKSEGVAERAARRRNRNDWMLLSFLTLLLCVVTYLNVRQAKSLDEVGKFRDQRIQQVQRRLEELAREGMQVSRDDVENLARIDKERVMWTQKLMAIAEVLPGEMAITGLYYHNRQLRINAISQIKKEEKEFDKVATMLDRLRNSEMFFSDFKKIQFTESKRVNVDDQSVLTMSFVASLEPDPSSMNKFKKATTSAAQKIEGGPTKAPAVKG
ncbi:MAG: hypothetical protein OEM52_03230 [bacterium]|nr:hypothetical protein [bacterium]